MDGIGIWIFGVIRAFYDLMAPQRLVLILPELETMLPRIPNLAFVAGLAAALAGSVNLADAKTTRGRQPVELIELRATGDPMLAIVSLRDQRITVYDAKGWIFRSPVSSGQKGREFPPEYSALSRKSRTTTRICMMTPSCPTCSGSPGRELRCMAVSCQAMLRLTAASECHSISRRACSRRPQRACA